MRRCTVSIAWGAFDPKETLDVQRNRLPVAQGPAYTGRQIGYPAIGPSLAVTGCSSIN
jgi:hypothetical protein